jgi:hypothetical protein
MEDDGTPMQIWVTRHRNGRIAIAESVDWLKDGF